MKNLAGTMAGCSSSAGMGVPVAVMSAMLKQQKKHVDGDFNADKIDQKEYDIPKTAITRDSFFQQ